MSSNQRPHSSSPLNRHSDGQHSFVEAGRPSDEHLAIFVNSPARRDTKLGKNLKQDRKSPDGSAIDGTRNRLHKDIQRSGSARSRLKALLHTSSRKRPSSDEVEHTGRNVQRKDDEHHSAQATSHTSNIPGRWPTPAASLTGEPVISRPGSILYTPADVERGEERPEHIQRSVVALKPTARSPVMEPTPRHAPPSIHDPVEDHGPTAPALHTSGNRHAHVKFVEESLGDVRQAPELWLVRDSLVRPSLEGVLDMTNSEVIDRQSITLDRSVVREVVQPVVHHIRQELISRDIHRPEVYRRILPIRDVQVRPARHFVLSPANDSLIEIDKPPAHSPSSHPRLHHLVTSRLPIPSDRQSRPEGSHYGHDLRAPQKKFFEPGVDRTNAAREIHTYSHYSPVLDDEARIRGETIPFSFHSSVIQRKSVAREQTINGNDQDQASPKKAASSKAHEAVDIIRKPRKDIVRSSDQRPPLHNRGTSYESQAPALQTMNEPLPESTIEVTPWVFQNEQEVAQDDLAVKGGHSIASEHGQELLRQRSTGRYKRV